MGGACHIFFAYFLSPCNGISQQNMALYGTVPLFQDLEIPTEHLWASIVMGYPQSWMVYFMENVFKVNDLGVPLFQETHM